MMESSPVDHTKDMLDTHATQPSEYLHAYCALTQSMSHYLHVTGRRGRKDERTEKKKSGGVCEPRSVWSIRRWLSIGPFHFMLESERGSSALRGVKGSLFGGKCWDPQLNPDDEQTRGTASKVWFDYEFPGKAVSNQSVVFCLQGSLEFGLNDGPHSFACIPRRLILCIPSSPALIIRFELSFLS